ncbi:hypothetical protein SDC9_136493 [bioreactor metagenome]|uniref:Uncharacterized protein n=1 Tax=bioreactor metagenome TaxID=1076179 RepID=A0A645DIT0_9ZZZZ
MKAGIIDSGTDTIIIKALRILCKNARQTIETIRIANIKSITTALAEALV